MTIPPNHTIGDAPIQEDLRVMMNAVAAGLDDVFNGKDMGKDRTIGFILLTFPYGSTGRCNYISNGARRDDVILLLEEQLAAFKAQKAAQ